MRRGGQEKRQQERCEIQLVQSVLALNLLCYKVMGGGAGGITDPVVLFT
jgi:hypothetical protein